MSSTQNGFSQPDTRHQHKVVSVKQTHVINTKWFQSTKHMSSTQNGFSQPVTSHQHKWFLDKSSIQTDFSQPETSHQHKQISVSQRQVINTNRFQSTRDTSSTQMVSVKHRQVINTKWFQSTRHTSSTQNGFSQPNTCHQHKMVSVNQTHVINTKWFQSTKHMSSTQNGFSQSETKALGCLKIDLYIRRHQIKNKTRTEYIKFVEDNKNTTKISTYSVR